MLKKYWFLKEKQRFCHHLMPVRDSGSGGLGRDKGRGKPSLWLRGLEDWRIGGLKGLVY